MNLLYLPYGTPPQIRTETVTGLSRFSLPIGVEELGTPRSNRNFFQCLEHILPILG